MGNMEMLDKIDFKKADPAGMIDNIRGFINSAKDALEISSRFSIPSYFIKAKKVVLAGMGGSGAADDVVCELLKNKPDLIVESIHDYSLPVWANNETLVVVNSYSGNTEESLSCFLEAVNRGAKIVCITTGGKLKVLAEKYKVPVIEFEFKGAPRASFPYLFILLLMIFVKLGHLAIEMNDFESLFASLTELEKKYGPEVSLFSNPAKIMAEKIHGTVPIIYCSEKLKGAALRFKNQINENGKNFSFVEVFPELNHNSIEGYAKPNEFCTIVMLESNFDRDRISLRQNLTAEIVRKNKIPLERVKFVNSKDQLSEVLAFVLFGDFVSYYLAILNKANPGTNDTIDYLKSKMA